MRSTSSVPPGVSYAPRDFIPTRRFSTMSIRPTPLAAAISFSSSISASGAELLAVHGNRRSLLESDLDRCGLCRAPSPATRSTATWILPARSRDLRARRLHGSSARYCGRGCKYSSSFARRGRCGAARRRSLLRARDVPFAPRRDDRQFRRERFGGQLKAHLIVAFARAAVSQGVGADFLARVPPAASRSPGARRTCPANICARRRRPRAASARCSR